MTAPEGLVVALLAAGRSTRFGVENKLLAPLGGRPLIGWAAATGLSVDAAQHFAVIAPGFPQQESLEGYALLPNPDAVEGMATSLRIAARHASELGASALLVLLGDMPLARPKHLTALLSVLTDDPTRPVFTRAPGGAPQPPALFPATVFPAIAALSGDSGARGLARGAAFIEAEPEQLIDVDTPADLALCAAMLDR